MGWFGKKSDDHGLPPEGSDAARLRGLVAAKRNDESKMVMLSQRVERDILAEWGNVVVDKTADVIIEYAERCAREKGVTSVGVKIDYRKLVTPKASIENAATSGITLYNHKITGIGWMFSTLTELTDLGRKLVARLRSRGFAVNYEPGLDEDWGSGDPCIHIRW